jgi:hypothetical protein
MISSTATATDNNGGTLAVYGSGTATWRGPDAGTVSFTNYGWTTNGIVGDVCLYCDRLGPDWEYTFTARTDGYFTMTYNVSGTGSAYFGGFGLNGWQIELDGIVVDDPTNVLDPDVSGTFSWPLLRDVTYTFALQNIANIHDNIPADISSMSGEFDWSISVPEPSSLTLLLSSMLGLLFMLRRGRV